MPPTIESTTQSPDRASTVYLSTDLLARPSAIAREYFCTFIRAGRIRYADNTPGPFRVPPAVIQAGLDAGMFTGISAFVDHASWFETPSLRNLAGRVTDAWWDELAQAAAGTVRMFDTPAGNVICRLFDQILADAQDGTPVPDLGLSLVFWPQWEPQQEEAPPDAPLTLAAFRHIESVDFVFQPAADGRVIEAMAALQALPPPRSRGPAPHPADSSSERLSHCQRSVQMPPEETPIYETGEEPVSAAAPRPDTLAAGAGTGASAWQTAMKRAAISAILAGSGLPAKAQEWLRRQHFESPEALEAAIEHERDHIAELRADGVVQIGETPPRGAHITLGRTGIEQVQAAFEAFLEGNQPPAGVQPLTGLRELYHVLSGDYEMYGVFQPDRVYLANVNSSTMAGLVANAMNKVVINAFQAYPMWWAPIVTIRDFPSLQDVRWITLGGVGELPTVAEGAAYTELTWDDQTETDSFVKKGGYLGLTIEAIDKDDTDRIRAAPRALAQAAWLTLSKSVSDIFTSNSGLGPTMSDSVALFDAGSHGNLLTTALSWSEWVVVRTAMMKQTELSSGERLGGLTAPRYLVVPVDLENTALQILASEGEPGGSDNDINPFAEGNTHNALLESARRRVVVVPLWTDTNNWAAVADPNLYPSIGLAFRYGRTPEIFSVASPTAGLMFTNDTLPVKVRFFYAVGPTDYRGLHKSNVA